MSVDGASSNVVFWLSLKSTSAQLLVSPAIHKHTVHANIPSSKANFRACHSAALAYWRLLQGNGVQAMCSAAAAQHHQGMGQAM
jgi:hypothetical protein